MHWSLASLGILALAACVLFADKGAEPAKEDREGVLPNFDDSIHSLALSPDGNLLAVGGGDFRGPGQLLVLDVRTGKTVLFDKSHKRAVWSLAFSPDGKRLASGAGLSEVFLWDVRDGTQVASLRGHRHYVHTLAFVGKDLLSAGCGVESKAILWDLAAKKAKATFKFSLTDERQERELRGVARKPEDDAKLNVVFRDPIEAMLHVVPSPDGKRLAAATQGREVRIWDPVTGKEDAPLKTDHGANLTRAVYSPDGKTMATSAGSDDGGTVRLWEVATGKKLAVLEGHKYAVVALAFSPDGKSLVSCGLDDTVRVWDVGARKEKFSLSPAKNRPSHTVVVSPDSKWFAAESGPGRVKRFSLADGKEMPFGK